MLVTVLRMESNNGYGLLWRLLEFVIHGFDPAIPVRISMWNNNNIFKYVSSFTLYYRLHSKKGVYHDDSSHGITFLHAITKSAYAEGGASPSSLASATTTRQKTTGTYRPISVSWALQRSCANTWLLGLPLLYLKFGVFLVRSMPLRPSALMTTGDARCKRRYDNTRGPDRSPDAKRQHSTPSQIKGGHWYGRSQPGALPRGCYVRPDQN
jgi:hypothetical protein